MRDMWGGVVICSYEHHHAGRVLIVYVSVASAPLPSLELSVVADLRAPPTSSGAPQAQTLVRWHPSFPAQLFVARGDRVYLVDLAGARLPAEWG